MIRYDVYGFKTLNLEEALSLVERTLGTHLDMRDSSYWGTYYCAGRRSIRDLMLYKNEQGEWHTPDYKMYGVILLVNELDDMDEICHKLTSNRTEPILLKSRIYPDESPEEEQEEFDNSQAV